MQQALQYIDPEQLGRISDLELLARTVVQGLASGLHRSPHSGSSIEFAHYRPYSQGDDPRHVDWSLYARTDRLHIKQYQEETNMRCTLLLDCSASMEYASGPLSKFRYAQMLVACLATLLNQQRDEVGLIGYHQEMCLHIPPRSQKHHLRRILVELDNLEPGGSTDTAETLRFLGETLAPRGMVVLISDLLHPLEGMIEHLKSLRARRHDLLVLQISDPSEREFPFDHSVTFIDAEDEREQFVIPDFVRQEYLENRRRHFDEIKRVCVGEEIDIEELDTGEPLDRALHHFLQKRNHALVRTSVKRQTSGGGRG